MNIVISIIQISFLLNVGKVPDRTANKGTRKTVENRLLS